VKASDKYSEDAESNYANDMFDRGDISKAFEAGAMWQKQQMEAYRIKHCKSLTNEQAELEDKFVSSHVEKNNRMPTFLDAIEYGIEYGKQQMIQQAVTAEVRMVEDFMGTTTFRCVYDKYKIGDKVKLIIIKED